jgi:thiamine monophosphate synthase
MVAFDSQGLATVAEWQQLVPLDVPLVTIIDGIGDTEMAREKQVGADCVTVIGMVMQNGDVPTVLAKCHNMQV